MVSPFPEGPIFGVTQYRASSVQLLSLSSLLRCVLNVNFVSSIGVLCTTTQMGEILESRGLHIGDD